MNGLVEKSIHEGGIYQFPGAAITKYHKLGGSDNRNVFSLSSGGWKSNIKTPTGLAPSESREGEPVPGLSPSFWWPQALLGL